MKTISVMSLFPLLVSSFEVKINHHYMDNSEFSQVFTFLLEAEKDVWSKLDWSKVTTLCYAGWIDSNLTRFAHDHGAKGTKDYHFIIILKLSFILSNFQLCLLQTILKTNFSTVLSESIGLKSKLVMLS